jgi:Arc/MetJ-type ribon-helix-helix transcriptional regulator
MARKSPTALDALQKLRTERQDLEAREAEARRAAALELGMIALDAGADRLDPGVFRATIAQAVKARSSAQTAVPAG